MEAEDNLCGVVSLLPCSSDKARVVGLGSLPYLPSHLVSATTDPTFLIARSEHLSTSLDYVNLSPLLLLLETEPRTMHMLGKCLATKLFIYGFIQTLAYKSI